MSRTSFSINCEDSSRISTILDFLFLPSLVYSVIPRIVSFPSSFLAQFRSRRRNIGVICCDGNGRVRILYRSWPNWTVYNIRMECDKLKVTLSIIPRSTTPPSGEMSHFSWNTLLETVSFILLRKLWVDHVQRATTVEVGETWLLTEGPSTQWSWHGVLYTVHGTRCSVYGVRYTVSRNTVKNNVAFNIE